MPGWPLLRGVARAGEAGKEPTLKSSILSELAVAIEGAALSPRAWPSIQSLQSALRHHGQAGGLGGVLEVVLNRLSEFMEKAQKIKGRSSRPCSTPSRAHRRHVILSILMVYVIPKFKDVFAGMLDNAQLPAFYPAGTGHQAM